MKKIIQQIIDTVRDQIEIENKFREIMHSKQHKDIIKKARALAEEKSKTGVMSYNYYLHDELFKIRDNM